MIVTIVMHATIYITYPDTTYALLLMADLIDSLGIYAEVENANSRTGASESVQCLSCHMLRGGKRGHTHT